MPSWWRALLIALSMGLPLASWGQNDTAAAFQPLLRRLYSERFYNAFKTPASFSLPIVYRDSVFDADKQRVLNFELQLADEPLALKRRIVQLNGHGYPVAYPVVFQNHLVALFKNGKFGCYNLNDLAPNDALERQLNTNNWKQFWLLNGKLVAQSASRTYSFEPASGWHLSKQPVPLGQRPKLYEDARYVAYSDCNGEFGGTVYFYNKQTRKTHRANATCANSLWQEDGKYRLLTSLGHLMGSAGCAIIPDPDVLPLATHSANEKVNWQYRFTLPEKGVTPVFRFHGLQLLSGFNWHNKNLYLMNWRQTSFLVTISNQVITIVDPLFADNLYTHDPITNSYSSDLAVSNINLFDLGERTVLATLIWQGQQLTKVEWNE